MLLFFESHIQCFSSQVLQTRDQEALRDSAGRKDRSREDRLVRPRGLLTWSVIGERDRDPSSARPCGRHRAACLTDAREFNF